MVAYLSKDDVATLGPKKSRQSVGQVIKFTKPKETVWASNKNWEFAQIQTFVTTLSTTYGLPVKKSMSKDMKMKLTIKCAEALGFFEKGICTTNDHINAHISSWISPLFPPASFLLTMSTLYAWFGRDEFPHKGKRFEELKANYKKAKSALDNNRFTPYASGVLRRHVQTLVTVGEEKDNKQLSDINPPGAPPPPAETMQAAVDALVALGSE